MTEKTDIEKLRAAVEADKQKRAEEFRQYIAEGAEKYRCVLAAEAFIVEGKIVTRISIRPQ